MSTKIKYEIVKSVQDAFNKMHKEEDGFLPKGNMDVLLIEFNHKPYEVVTMERERSKEEEIDNVIKYYIKEVT